jgi:hypothetical protein
MVRTAAILGLMSAVAACSTSGRHRAENGDAVAKENRIVPPTTQQELKHLPKGLLPDTTNAVHTN